MRKMFCLFVMVIMIGGLSTAVIAKNIIDVSNQADKKFGVKFEIVAQNGSAILRTSLAPFIRINKDERRGKMAAEICLQAKLVELTKGTIKTKTESGYTLSFSGFVTASIEKSGKYLVINLGKAKVDGKKINFK